MTLWRTMWRIISNDFAKNINCKGVNGKLSLAALQLKDVVIGKDNIHLKSVRSTLPATTIIASGPLPTYRRGHERFSRSLL